MDIRTILLAVSTYPDRVPDETLESAFRLAEILGAGLTAAVFQLDGDRSTWPAVMGTFPLDFPHMMQELVTRSELNAASSSASLEILSREYESPLDSRRKLANLYGDPKSLIDLARLHDLLVLPVPEINSFDRSWIEPAIFQSGRPLLLLPSEGKHLHTIDRVVLAWDYSREAARALGDALSILHHAREVQVVTAFGEKHVETTCTSADLDKYFSAHKIRYSLQQLTIAKGNIGDLLMEHAQEAGASMLVMGCYGHSRAREWVLGGVSRTLLQAMTVPVFLAH